MAGLLLGTMAPVVDGLAAAVGAYTGFLGGILPLGPLLYLPTSAALSYVLGYVATNLFLQAQMAEKGSILSSWPYWKYVLTNALIVGGGVALAEVVMGAAGLQNPLILAAAAFAIGYGASMRIPGQDSK